MLTLILDHELGVFSDREKKQEKCLIGSVQKNAYLKGNIWQTFGGFMCLIHFHVRRNIE